MDAEQIIEIRKRLKLTQHNFAKLLGCSVTTVNRWENGKCKPYWLYIKALNKIQHRFKI